MKATFRFGIHPKDKKDITKDFISEVMLPKEKVYIPLSQHIGAPCKPVVSKGDEVKAGTLIGEASGFVSANIFSSVSGIVEGIIKRESVSGQKIDHIVIRNDNNYIEKNMPVLENPCSEDIIKRTKDAGIVGMGGACFPTHIKLSPKKPIKYLIINGAECEPYITADYRLMIERPEELVEGIKLLQKALKADVVYLGIENNKPQAIEEMKKHCKDEIIVVPLKTKYPQGGEKQLIYALTRLEVPRGGLPSDVGCVVDNVGTALAVYEAVTKGKPSYERYMTISGKGVKNPKNLLVKTGMPFEEIVEKLEENDYIKAISGGPMMGISLSNLNAVTTKGTSSLLLLSKDEIRESKPSPCINCSRCHRVCPINLMPMMIDHYIQKNDLADAEEYDPMSCIECGSCAFVCPSRIPLVQSIRLAKKLIKERK